ncbi:MAG TPA: ABC transporter permease [Herpetosiphonaceae bacterium]
MTTTTTRSAPWAAVRAGLSRGWIETRQASVVNYVFPSVVYAGTVLFLRRLTVPGTNVSIGAMVLPSLLGMLIAFSGLTGPASVIATDAEDGTLLRAKATPHGMLGYLVGKIVMFALTALAGLVPLIVPGIMVAGELAVDARTLPLLALIFVAGMVATVPIGLALGAKMKSSLQAGIVLLVTLPVVLLSGIFYPLSRLPAWLQWVGQAFPFYWVGLGARAAMLPPEMAAVEIGASWRTAEMIAVLGAWGVLGLALAPAALRHLARRQSGSTVAAARDRIMAKGY